MAMHEKSPELKEKISFLPDTPGVYTYYDAKGKVIYVGKAKNLKRRVSSYFNRTHESLRTNMLVDAIADMSYIVVPTEQDALNLENSMIKEYKPKYNVLLKDDKSYPWIVVTNELYPRVFLTRQYVRNGSKYFGPYTNGAMAKAVLGLLGEMFPIRTCRIPITEASVKRGNARVCLKYHIHRCRGCCVGKISPEEYNKYIDHIKQILRGETHELMVHLRDEMQRLASELRFEEAQELKVQYDLIAQYRSRSVIISQIINEIDVFGVDDEDDNVYINYMHVSRGAVVRSVTLRYRRNLDEGVGQLLAYALDEIASAFGVVYDEVVVPEVPDVEMPSVTFSVPQRGDRAKLLDVSRRNARQARINDLKHLAKHNPEERVMRTLEQIKSDFRLNVLPHHIECFDNSNIQGTNPVASCVVFRDARPCKRDYRHFKIKTVVGANDFASMKEVLTRRYTRLMEEGKDLPQLIVVDGGKGQLSSAVEALDEMGLRGRIAVVGIAKRLEEIYFPGDSIPLYIDKSSESLRVVQHLRDEAHRFGITFHRELRSKGQTVSALDEIRGIGPATRDALLRHFRSVAAIRRAAPEDLAAVIGPAKAALVHNALCSDVDPDTADDKSGATPSAQP